MLTKLSLLIVSAMTASTVFAKTSVPVDRFAKVDPGVYRGAVIDTDAKMAYLKKVGVRTVVSMITDQSVHTVEQTLADKYGIKLVWIPVDGFYGPNDKQTEEIQATLNDQSERPVYIHCTHGRDRTGVEIGLYRVKTDHWTAHKAYAEMKKRGFRTVLIFMANYFKSRSGYEDEEKAGMDD